MAVIPRLLTLAGDDGHQVELVYDWHLGAWREPIRAGFDERIALLLPDARVAIVEHHGTLRPPRDTFKTCIFDTLDAALQALPDKHREHLEKEARRGYAWVLARRVERSMGGTRWHAR